jgi:hypothetical protein
MKRASGMLVVSTRKQKKRECAGDISTFSGVTTNTPAFLDCMPSLLKLVQKSSTQYGS